MTIREKLIAVFIILAVMASTIIFMFYPNSNPLGNTFVLEAVLMIIRNIAMWGGVVAIILRLFKVWKNKRHTLYILIGVTNVVLGLLMLVLYNVQPGPLIILNMFFINLIIGVIILGDIFLLK